MVSDFWAENKLPKGLTCCGLECLINYVKCVAFFCAAEPLFIYVKMCGFVYAAFV